MVIKSEYNSAYRQAATEKAYREAKQDFYSDCVAERLTGEELTECLDNKIKSAREPQRAEDDLRAQMAMADWALGVLVVSGFLGVVSLIVAGLGVMYVKRTLDATVRAVRAAEDTAIATSEIGSRQVRAYVHPIKFILDHAKDEFLPNVIMSYENFGQSSARNIIIDIIPYFVIMGTGKRKEVQRETNKMGFDLGPGQSRAKSAVFSFNNFPGMLDGIEKGMVKFHVSGNIHYRDVFDKPHDTAFHIMLYIDDDGLQNRTENFVLCEDGNWST